MKFLSVIILVKAFEQYFPVVLFIMFYRVVHFHFEPVDEILKCTIQMKAFHMFEQNFPPVLFD